MVTNICFYIEREKRVEMECRASQRATSLSSHAYDSRLGLSEA